MVYSGNSSSSHSKEELQYVASAFEHALNSVIGKFGFDNINELLDQKRVVSHHFLDSSAGDVIGLSDKDYNDIYLDQLSPYFAENPPSGFSGWDDPEIQGMIARELMRSALTKMPGAEAALTYANIIDSAKSLTDDPGSLSLLEERFEENLIHDKIQICALPNSLSGTGEATDIGINISANEEYSFYVHEGTHFIQRQYAMNIPRWLSEGQAVLFSGQKIASSRDGKDVAKILTFYDEGMSSFYDYYGLAYKALAKKKSIPEIIEFIQAYDLNDTWNDDSQLMEDPNLLLVKRAWENSFPDWVTYDEFSRNYDALAK